tara:strand:- start:9320 stop:9706 length:387 start_codon:yes stop_codon:yes gene_type:complete
MRKRSELSILTIAMIRRTIEVLFASIATGALLTSKTILSCFVKLLYILKIIDRRFEMEIEDIQADERYEAIDNLTDYVVAVMKNIVYNIGGDEELFINYLAHKEVIGDIMDGLLEAMPSDYGVKTKCE